MGFAQNSLISCIYDMALRHSTWDNILDILKASLPECLILVYGDDLAKRSNIAFAQRGLSSQAASTFVSTYAAVNPWLEAQAQMAPYQVFHDDQLLPREDAAATHVDLFSERHEVRETARRNLYTGKTFNSVENIAQFFADRQMPVPRGLAPQPGPQPGQQQAKHAGTPVQGSGAQGVPPRPQSAPAPAPRAPVVPIDARRPAAKKPFGSGSTILHPKYGRGTVMKREGDGDDAKLTVSFPKYGLKKLIEKFAGIKVDE